jgi:hypothetical protein
MRERGFDAGWQVLYFDVHGLFPLGAGGGFDGP